MQKGIWVAVLLLAPDAVAQPPAGASEAFQKVCGECHTVDTATSQRRTRAQSVTSGMVISHWLCWRWRQPRRV